MQAEHTTAHSTIKAIRKGARGALVALACAATLLGCNDHPLVKIENVLTATQDDRFVLPPKTKLDILFVIDNSGSMCEEQVNLGANFEAFASFLFNDLGDNADYRLAVTSTDLRTAGQGGRFLNTPAQPMQLINCTGVTPNTADCPAQLPLILKSENIANEQQLVTNFRCMATLGTQGDGFEKGLEAMRLSLSCNGPNREQFGKCCVPREGLTPEQAVNQPDGFVYDPFCFVADETEEPEFLRPDSLLVVVFVTDENDCSDPASNPPASNLAICKYGEQDGDGNGIPDGYRDQTICRDASGNPINEAECFQRECGGLGAADCLEQRCLVSRAINSNCEWFRDRLVPVADYQDFLNNLKIAPERQIIVASIVGSRAFTDTGEEIFFNPPEIPSNPGCDPDNPAFGSVGDDVCCPNGQCEGRIQPSCQSDNGIAFAGRRYLQLAESFDVNGIGCPVDDEFGECVTICVDDFAAPLQVLKEKVTDLIGKFCLEKRPACLVPTEDMQDTEPCDSEAEFNDARNYAFRVRLESCVTPGVSREMCPEFTSTVVPVSGYDIAEDNTCAGGFLVSLNDLPPANSRVQLEYIVGTGEPAIVEPAVPQEQMPDGAGGAVVNPPAPGE
ncbi:MAG: hypothetical protein ACE366_04795 [Bradymonadia bacterium]